MKSENCCISEMGARESMGILDGDLGLGMRISGMRLFSGSGIGPG